MQLKFLLPALLLANTVNAQLVVTPGAQFFVNGNTQVTLLNTDLINDGNLNTGNSTFSFTGNTTSTITGSQPIQFNELEINKGNNNSVLLQRSIAVSQRLLFSAGFLNLNGFNTDLGNTGHLDGEQEDSRVIGPNGGAVLFNTNLNFPTFSNPANLGIFITANQDLGNVTIKRGHQSQVNAQGAGNSILRYYDILPANNANPNATLRFRYFDGELNGLNENIIGFLRSPDNTTWTNLGFNSRDITNNFVEKTSINSFGRFTLSNSNNPLPLRFILFNAHCESNKMKIVWKTAQEQNTGHFNIERSIDGIQWSVIGSLPAAGNNPGEQTYSFTDNAPLQNGLYRIAEHDVTGSVQYTSILRSSCNTTDAFSVWPNPVQDMLFINIVTGNESPSDVRIFDSKGALVRIQKVNLLRGGNQFSIDMRSLAKGVYQLSVVWNNGQTKKTVQVVK